MQKKIESARERENETIQLIAKRMFVRMCDEYKYKHTFYMEYILHGL